MNGSIYLTEDSKLYDKVLQIAKDIREKETGQEDSYNLCGKVSNLIKDELKKNDIWCKLVIGHYCINKKLSLTHKWLRVGDFILDATADQFKGNPDILFTTEKPKQYTCEEDWYKEIYGIDYRPYDEYLFEISNNLTSEFD